MGFVSAARYEDLVDPGAPRRCTRRIAVAGGRRLERNVRANTPVDTSPWKNTRLRRRGQLRSRNRAQPVEPFIGPGGSGYQRRVVNDDPVAAHVNYPTRPHVIRPRIDRESATVLATGRSRGTVHGGNAHLAFRVGPGGRMVFAREVKHPGTQGAFFMELGAAKTEAELDEIARIPVQRMEAELVKGASLRSAAAA